MGFYHIQEVHTHEYLYRSANMSEAHWLLGTSVKFYPCVSYTRDIANDPHPTWGHPEDINIVFDDNPKAKLRKLNWLAEDENLPYLVYISNIVYPRFKEFKKKHRLEGTKKIKQYFDEAFNEDGTPSNSNSFFIPVKQFSKVVVPYNMEVKGEQKFIVTEIIGDSVNPFIWNCKLAPYREQVDMKPETIRIDQKLSTDIKHSISGHAFLKNVKY